MDWLNLDVDMLNEIKNGEYDAPEFEIKSDVLKVIVDKAYVTTTDNGAKRFDIEFKTENGRTIFATEYVTSGNDKDNKSYYIDKNGKPQPLQGVIRIQKFFKACGIDMAKAKTEKTMVEMFGSQKEAIYFPECSNKKMYIALQAYEDDYSGEIKIKTRVIDFISLNDEKLNEKIEKYQKRFERTPVVPLKTKKEPTTTKQDVDLSKW